MGVYISLHASNKVNPAQWEKAYEETLILVDKFNFIEIQKLKNSIKNISLQSKAKNAKIPTESVGERMEKAFTWLRRRISFYLAKLTSPTKMINTATH